MSNKSLVENALNTGEGILRLVPAWVPRSFMMPGGRLKLHPADLYALGAHRGGINERWFSSTTNASNGPGTPADEGLSYVEFEDKRVPAQRSRGMGRRQAAGHGGHGKQGRLEPALQVLRQHGPDPASHAPE